MVEESAMVVCPACGDQPACPQCGHLRAEGKFCAMCGTRLGEALAPGTDAAPGRPATDCEVSPADLAIDAEEQALLELINQHRAGHGKEALSFGKPALNRAAAWLSRDMATNNNLGHTDSRGRTLDRLTWCGVRFTTAAENIAAWPADAPSVFALWRDSIEHDANLLRDQVRFAGIARAFNADAAFGWYWTLDVTDQPAPGAVRQRELSLKGPRRQTLALAGDSAAGTAPAESPRADVLARRLKDA